MRRTGKAQDVKELDMDKATRELFSPKGEKTHQKTHVPLSLFLFLISLDEYSTSLAHSVQGHRFPHFTACNSLVH